MRYSGVYENPQNQLLDENFYNAEYSVVHNRFIDPEGKERCLLAVMDDDEEILTVQITGKRPESELNGQDAVSIHTQEKDGVKETNVALIDGAASQTIPIQGDWDNPEVVPGYNSAQIATVLANACTHWLSNLNLDQENGILTLEAEFTRLASQLYSYDNNGQPHRLIGAAVGLAAKVLISANGVELHILRIGPLAHCGKAFLVTPTSKENITPKQHPESPFFSSSIHLGASNSKLRIAYNRYHLPATRSENHRIRRLLPTTDGFNDLEQNFINPQLAARRARFYSGVDDASIILVNLS